LIRKIEKLEQERVRQGQQIAEACGLKIEELTASRLVSLVHDPEQAASINWLTERFAHVLADLKAANELNGQLIRQSLELVQRSIDLMTCLPDSGTYTDKGDSGKAVGQRRIFDLQA
jgi:flagellar biosynthesis/type III secretory pathway chaperone